MKLEQQVTGRTKLRGGGYSAIHHWLEKYFGKADRCEMKSCKIVSPKVYNWALISGKKHQHIRGNYMRLCGSCHRRYDQKPEWIEKMRKTKTGTRLSKNHRMKISQSMKGKNIGNTNAKKS